MLPLLDIKTTEQKNIIKAKNSHNSDESESTGFAEIFNTLSLDSTSKKSKPNTKNTKTPQTSTTLQQNALAPKQQESNFLKSLDAKYNLFENFKKDSKPAPSSAKDLLDFSQTNHQKTLKDLKEVAENLKLNVQKISIESSPKETQKTTANNVKANVLTQKDSTLDYSNVIKPNLESKNLTPKNTPLQNKVIPDSKIIQNFTRPNSAKTESEPILNTLLHDKELLTKDSKLKTIKPKDSDLSQSVKATQDKKQEISAKDTKINTNVESQNTKLKPTQTEPKTIESTKEQDPKATTHNKEIKESKIKPDSKETPKSVIKETSKTTSKESPKDFKNVQNLAQERQSEKTLDIKSEQMHFDLKQDQIKQNQNAQENFLDNFLKPSIKIQKEIPKEAQPAKEKESQKLNQEIYQNTFQNQRDMRFNVQNTFTHFSDRLRDAIASYRPPVTKISLELNPENLGNVELTIAKNGDKLSVQISSNQNALQLIMQNTQEFKNSLNNLGFQNVELDFKDNQGNSLESGNFNGGNENGGNQGGGFQQHNQNQQEMQNFAQNLGQNAENTQTWNENSLHIHKEANNPYARVALVEINFSYYA
ncbi:flagellar hook-length control protein FliK [Helicobacter sp.]|uniref:flagellar hook-length control protein FliK n=1 Tax=Helicobacter sp. TaxID=218 RepID=UPI0025C3EB9B|nr:flagellar hook-length control protein FliK [Helicobacter sp.]MCI5632724.1 flagellar hook-length control protein FliK [Helicobacter sp.]